MSILYTQNFGFRKFCIVVSFFFFVYSQPQTNLYANTKKQILPIVAQAQPDETYNSPLAERIRESYLSANERALEHFFKKNLPPQWKSIANKTILTLKRKAPVYILPNTYTVPPLTTNAGYLALAKKNGRKDTCEIQFRIERHDDVALIRQKVRLYKEIRQDIEKAYERLQLKFLCRGISAVECSISGGKGKNAALEYLRTRGILAQKLEVTPLYRVGTLYLYPLKNQCVTPEHDWYVTNTKLSESDTLLPFEAREEIQIILKNMENIKFWE
ncbi:MAG: hypothetical protein LDLANPLL_01773 [Turneriella sp.]|nr:hypothetical protein [Turneriella sp.]